MTSECEKYKEKIVEYLDGMLGDDEVHEIEEHLARCVECASAVEKEKKLLGMLTSLPQQRAPELLRVSILAELDKTQARFSLSERLARLLTLPRLRIAMECAALFIVALVGWHVYRSGVFGTKLDNKLKESQAKPAESPAVLRFRAPVKERYAETDLRFSQERMKKAEDAKRVGSASAPAFGAYRDRAKKLSPTLRAPESRENLAGAAVIHKGELDKAEIAAGQVLKPIQTEERARVPSSLAMQTQVEAAPGAEGAGKLSFSPEAEGRSVKERQLAEAPAEGTKEKMAAVEVRPSGEEVIRLIVRPETEQGEKRRIANDLPLARKRIAEESSKVAQTVHDVIKRFGEARVVTGDETISLGLALKEAGERGGRKTIVVDLPSRDYVRFLRGLEEAGLRVEETETSRILAKALKTETAMTQPQRRVLHAAAQDQGRIAATQEKIQAPALAASPAAPASRAQIVALGDVNEVKKSKRDVLRIEIIIGDAE
jgi:hypothetical protein